MSKIVASMWDSLDAESKGVYKKKTEAAKKDYLKALAAYRASFVSKVRISLFLRWGTLYFIKGSLRLLYALFAYLLNSI